MEIYHNISVLIFLTMLFAYLNARFIKWPSTVGIMALSLISSILLVAFGYYTPWLSNEAKMLIAGINFKLVLLEIMLSFLLFAGVLVTYIIVIFSIIVQGLSVGRLARRLLPAPGKSEG